MNVKRTIRPVSGGRQGALAEPRRCGAAAVEFAIVAPVIFLLILCLIEFGRGLMVMHLLNNAARQGGRVATIEGKATSDVNTAVTNALQGQPTNGITTTVTVAGAVADANTAKAGDEIIVSVSLPVSTFTWLPFSQYLSGNLTGVYSLRRE
jgi:Flp pilus assembly protein TadG